MQRPGIAIVDFGSQYTHLIAKRVRQLGAYSEIISPNTSIQDMSHICGIILSGGPHSVFGNERPEFNESLLDVDLPILGLCYGHQLIAQHFGGEIQNTGHGEFGKAMLSPQKDSVLWENVTTPTQVWMSHGDSVTQIPEGFEAIGYTSECPAAALQHQSKPIYTLQFHPEVTDSLDGTHILQNFLNQCDGLDAWSMEQFLQEMKEQLPHEVNGRSVLMFLSGGVDSSIAFALLNEALGTHRVLGVFIDNGFSRKYEKEEVLARYEQMGLRNIRSWDASKEFLDAIAGKVDPQEKRHIVGAEFIEVRKAVLKDLDLYADEWMLGQGTLYPDIIESGGTEHSQVIKSHHNRVEEVQDLIEQGLVVEPIKDLYKDEVRQLGEIMGLPSELVWRHPFPGPGLSINVLCSHGDEAEDLISEDLRKQLKENVLLTPYQAEVLPVRSVGVQGDQRTYAPPAVLMGPPNWDELEKLSIQITNQIRGVNRVVYLLEPSKLPKLTPKQAYCTKDRLDLLRDADFLATQAFHKHKLMQKIFQLLVILLPLSSKGSGESIVLRPVCSEDVMTAQFAKLPWDVVGYVAKQIMALNGVDAVFYDVTHKPPATFGWE